MPTTTRQEKPDTTKTPPLVRAARAPSSFDSNKQEQELEYALGFYTHKNQERCSLVLTPFDIVVVAGNVAGCAELCALQTPCDSAARRSSSIFCSCFTRELDAWEPRT